jgi:AraC-like DNA-binding protein
VVTVSLTWGTEKPILSSIGYHLEEYKNLMLNEKLSNFSLIEIALESGFSYKTAFNTDFKKHAGMTPSQFRKAATIAS